MHSVERAGGIARGGGGALETAIYQRKRRRVATLEMDQLYVVLALIFTNFGRLLSLYKVRSRCVGFAANFGGGATEKDQTL